MTVKFVISRQNLHQLILNSINVLKLINHDVFQTLLPFQTNFRILRKYVEYKHKKIVVVNAETLLLLIKIAVKNNVVRFSCRPVFLIKIL